MIAMFTSYFDSAEDVTVSADRAQEEVWRHGHSFVEFQAQYGVRDSYPAQVVLTWLGY